MSAISNQMRDLEGRRSDLTGERFAAQRRAGVLDCDAPVAKKDRELNRRRRNELGRPRKRKKKA
jgi:hypothetical protein